MRKFEKISFERFSKDIEENKKLYDDYLLPKRSTIKSAGYDFFAIEDFSLFPNETKYISTGIKVKLNSDEVLLLLVRSSMGFKYNIRMCNQVGVIDSDYYNNIDNEGHIWIALKNEGDKVYKVNKGDKYVQGIIIKYLTVDNEKKDLNIRTGGFGSTNEGD